MLVIAEDGPEDREVTEVRLTAREYREILRDLAVKEEYLERQKELHNIALETAKKEAEEDKRNIQIAAQEEINKIVEEKNAQLKQMTAAFEKTTGLNKNLLRITREKANARRGLQPKKTSTGYRFSGKIMQTRAICGYERNEGPRYATVWTAILETPYDGTIPFDQIDEQIQADLVGNVLELLGVNWWTFQNSGELWKGTYREIMEDENLKKESFLFDYSYLVNTKTRLWEVQINTTGPIVAAEELLGRKPAKKSRETAHQEEF